jgi:ribosomal protein S18 acetylase RimI-like enzyme
MALGLRAMTEEEFWDYSRQAAEEYGRELVASGIAGPDFASEAGIETLRHHLPLGLATPNHFLFTAEEAGQPIGVLWLAALSAGDLRYGWVYDIVVRPEHRGRGYGKAMMRLAEEECRRLGLSELRLNVFGHNTVARRLYESLGYRPLALTMGRRLDQPAGVRTQDLTAPTT